MNEGEVFRLPSLGRSRRRAGWGIVDCDPVEVYDRLLELLAGLVELERPPHAVGFVLATGAIGVTGEGETASDLVESGCEVTYAVEVFARAERSKWRTIAVSRASRQLWTNFEPSSIPGSWRGARIESIGQTVQWRAEAEPSYYDEQDAPR